MVEGDGSSNVSLPANAYALMKVRHFQIQSRSHLFSIIYWCLLRVCHKGVLRWKKKVSVLQHFRDRGQNHKILIRKIDRTHTYTHTHNPYIDSQLLGDLEWRFLGLSLVWKEVWDFIVLPVGCTLGPLESVWGASFWNAGREAAVGSTGLCWF